MDEQTSTESSASRLGPVGTLTVRARGVHRPAVNITPAERLLRAVLGIAGMAAGALLLASASGATAIALEVLLVLAGLDLLVTGALGHCPLYRALGHVPAALRRQA